MMLNSDMSLIKDLSNITTSGKVSCEYDACGDANADTLTWVKSYAADNTLFISEFSNAFQRIITNGYTNLVEISSS